MNSSSSQMAEEPPSRPPTPGSSALNSPESHRPSIPSSPRLATIETASNPEQLPQLTREMDRVLDRLREIQNTCKTRKKEANSYLGRIERRVKDMAKAVAGIARSDPEATPRPRNRTFEANVKSFRDVASGRTPTTSVAIRRVESPPLRLPSPTSSISDLSLEPEELDEIREWPEEHSSLSEDVFEAPSPMSSQHVSLNPPSPPRPFESVSTPSSPPPPSAHRRPRARRVRHSSPLPPDPALADLRGMLVQLQQDHVAMIEEGREIKNLAQQLVDRQPWS